MGNNSDPITLHKYLYANVDPVNNIDPTGNISLPSLGTAINVVGNLVGVATASYHLFQFASGEKEATAKEIGLSMLMVAAGPAAGRLANMLVAKHAATAAGAAGLLSAGVIKLNAKVLKRVVAADDYKTYQKSVSIPRIERYVTDMVNGDKFPPIKVDGNVIVDGHHRYIAAKVAGKSIDVVPGNLPSFKKKMQSKPLTELFFDTVDF
jgi:hypothetical protein